MNYQVNVEAGILNLLNESELLLAEQEDIEENFITNEFQTKQENLVEIIVIQRENDEDFEQSFQKSKAKRSDQGKVCNRFVKNSF
jgi:hypothetical protein